MRKLLLEWVEINKFRELNKRQLNKIREDYIVFKDYKKDKNGQLSSDQEQDVQTTVEKVLNTIIKEIDPTYNARKENYANQYQQWILTQFQKQPKNVAVFDEDLPKYRTQIERYIKYKLPTQITKYSTLQDLLTQLNTYEQENNIQTQETENTYSNIPDSLETFINNGELLKIKEFDKYIMYVPLTEEQSIQVGTDTEWCTQYTERDTLFYNYAKSPLFSIRSKKVYKDNYQFYFAPRNLNLKDNQDNDIDIVKFNNEHPDIIQFFKDFISENSKYQYIYDLLVDKFNNITKNAKDNIDIEDYGFSYEFIEDEDGNEIEVIEDSDENIYKIEELDNIIDNIYYDNKKNEHWLNWDLKYLKSHIKMCELLYTIYIDNINKIDDVELLSKEFYNLEMQCMKSKISKEIFKIIISSCKDKFNKVQESGIFTRRTLTHFIKISDGILLSQIPERFITKDMLINIIQVSGSEILDNIDFKNNKYSLELQKVQIDNSDRGLLAIYKQMMPSDEIFEYQLGKKSSIQFTLLLKNIIPNRIPNQNIFEYQVNRILDENTAISKSLIISEFLFNLQKFYNTYPNYLNEEIIIKQAEKTEYFIIYYIIYFPKILKNKIIEQIDNENMFLFHIIKTIINLIEDKTPLYTLGYNQDILIQYTKSIFYKLLKNTTDIIEFIDTFKYYCITFYTRWLTESTSEEKNKFNKLFLEFLDEIVYKNINKSDSKLPFSDILSNMFYWIFGKTGIGKNLIINILNKSLIFFECIAHYLMIHTEENSKTISELFTPLEIYNIYKNSKDKILEIFHIYNQDLYINRNSFKQTLSLDNIITEDELYNMIQNKDDTFMLEYFNTLSDNFIIKIYDKLYGKSHSQINDVDFYQHTDQLKRLLVKKEQKNLFKKILDI